MPEVEGVNLKSISSWMYVTSNFVPFYKKPYHENKLNAKLTE